jgi:YbgC/YbaW family acyl-CoA thioester hydrolase
MVRAWLRGHPGLNGSVCTFASTVCRRNATAPAAVKTDPSSENIAVSPRWLTDLKARIGKCITFGMPPALVDEASTVLRELGTNWRDLVAGSEGFLTDPRRAGLHRVPIQWGDQDSMGHVNNVQYVRWCETGRTNWTRKYGKYFDVKNKQEWDELLTARGVGLILRSITVDFKFPMTWPDKISVYHRLRERPGEETESMMLDVMILSELRQRPAARALEDVVVYDYRKAKKGPLPLFMLEQFRETFELQEKAKRENQASLADIEQRVRALEMQSWDRPDAKEDFGSQG